MRSSYRIGCYDREVEVGVVEQELSVEIVSEMGAVATIGPVLIHIVRLVTDVERVRAVGRVVHQLVARHPSCVSFSVIEPGAVARQSRDAYEESVDLIRNAPVAAALTVIEGSGFRAAAARSAVAGFYMLTRRPYPHKVFSTVQEGTGWARQSMAGVTLPSEQAIVRAIEQVRARIPVG
jgi:hypothetical protein